MSLSDHTTSRRMGCQRVFWTGFWALLALLSVTNMMVSNPLFQILLFPVYAMLFVRRTLPMVTWDWGMALSGLGALVMAVVVLHFVMRRLLPQRWRWKLTLVCSGLTMVFFGICLSTLGVVEHFQGWTTALKDRNEWQRVRYGHKQRVATSLVSFSSDMQLHVPPLPSLDRLEDVVYFGGEQDPLNRSVIVPVKDRDVPEVWIYLGSVPPWAPDDTPVVAEPRPDEGQRRFVVTKDEKSTYLTEEEWAETLLRWRSVRAQMSRVSDKKSASPAEQNPHPDRP